MVNRDIINLELSLKQREESLKVKKRHLYIVRDEYDQLTKKSKFFFSEVAELMSKSDDSYYFKDLESQHFQASQKLQTYFQEQEELLKQSQKLLEIDKEQLKQLEREVREKNGG